MRKTGLIILMTAAALSMSACGRTEKPESTKPSGTVANEKETVKKTEKETEKATEKKTEAQTEDQTEKETLSESESEAAATDENVLQLDAELSELLDKMYAIKGPDFDVETDTVDFDDEYAVSSYTGLTMDDVKKLDEKQFIDEYKDYRYTFELIEK